jgi:regulator of sigma E protease
LNFVLAICALGLLIALHEFGHLVAARLVGMRVERYSIGFGPVLCKFRKGETEYCLSAIPIGGYVKIAGMTPGDSEAPGEAEGHSSQTYDPHTFNHRPAWQRVLVIAAGPLTNELLAVLLVYIVAIAGMPYTRDPVVGEVLPGSAAVAAGLLPGDRVAEVDGQTLGSFGDLVGAIHDHPGETVALDIVRNGETQRLTAKLGTPAVLGVAAPIRRYSPLDAIPAAIAWTGRQTVGTIEGVVNAALHPRSGQLEGPIGTVQVTVQEAEHGWQSLLFTLSLISLALAIFNALPWPALDGGRLIFLIYELVFRRPVNQKVETAIHATGFLLLLALIGLVTVGDVRRLRQPKAPEAATAVSTLDGGG